MQAIMLVLGCWVGEIGFLMGVFGEIVGIWGEGA